MKLLITTFSSVTCYFFLPSCCDHLQAACVTYWNYCRLKLSICNLTNTAKTIDMSAGGKPSNHSVPILTHNFFCTEGILANILLFIKVSSVFCYLRQLARYYAQRFRNPCVMLQPHTAQLLLYVPSGLTL